MKTLIKQIREYAESNYDQRGWSNIVEATTDDELVEEYLTIYDYSGELDENCNFPVKRIITDFKEAIKAIDDDVNLYEDKADDIRATAF